MSDTPRTDALMRSSASVYALHELTRTLERELAAALTDARRYRHLRHPAQLYCDKATHAQAWQDGGYAPMFDAELDAAIDAEIARIK